MGKKDNDLFGGRVDPRLVIGCQIFEHDGIDLRRDEARNRHYKNRQAVKVELADIRPRVPGNKQPRYCLNGQEKASGESHGHRDGESGNNREKFISSAIEQKYQD